MLGKFKRWFLALSLIGKVGFFLAVISTGAIVNAVGDTPRTEPLPEPPPQVQSDKVEVKAETTTEKIPFETKTIEDANLASGKEEVRTEGVDGVKTKSWKVTYTNNIETDRSIESEETTTQPVTKVIARGTKVAKPAPAPAPSNCDPNYSGCVPIASDVDCAGGGGNGPAYVSGPINVIGSDIYDLDRDNDGIACE